MPGEFIACQIWMNRLRDVTKQFADSVGCKAWQWFWPRGRRPIGARGATLACRTHIVFGLGDLSLELIELLVQQANPLAVAHREHGELGSQAVHVGKPRLQNRLELGRSYV